MTAKKSNKGTKPAKPAKKAASKKPAAKPAAAAELNERIDLYVKDEGASRWKYCDATRNYTTLKDAEAYFSAFWKRPVKARWSERGETAKKPAPAAKAAAAPAATLPSTAELKAHTGASKVKSPVAAVWELCEAMPNAKRREVVAAAVAQGVNFHTARTQYQAWLTAKRAEGKA